MMAGLARVVAVVRGAADPIGPDEGAVEDGVASWAIEAIACARLGAVAASRSTASRMYRHAVVAPTANPAASRAGVFAVSQVRQCEQRLSTC